MTTDHPVLLGVDLGTSSVKVIVAGLDGEVFAQAGATYPVDRPHSGWNETDPADWWAAVRSAVAAVLAAYPGPPTAIGFSGQMHGLVVCDPTGTPLRPAMLWSDSRAEEQLGVYRSLPPDVLLRLGNPLSPGMAGPMLGWLARHDTDVYSATRWALSPKDWIRARMTGRFDAEPSDASATLLYDLTTEDWDPDVLHALGLDPAVLPTLLRSSGQPAGVLQPEAAADLGLPAEIPVAAGAGDAAAAALGSGLVRPGEVQLTVGTGAQLLTPTAPPTLTSLTERGAPVTHTYRSATSDGWYAMAAVLNGGLTLDWVRRTVGASWADLYAAAGASRSADDPIFLPHLNGERTPYMDTTMRGSWVGLSARHTPVDLMHSALEGVAFALADGLDALPVGAARVTDLRLAGGGSTAPGWRQLMADVLNVRLHALDVTNASARGGALTAALAAGLIGEAALRDAVRPVTTLVAEPDPERAAFYAARRTRFARVLAAVRGAW